LLDAGTPLLCPQLLLRLLQLMPQLCLRLPVLRQLGFQLAPLLAGLARALLGPFPTLGFFGQRFCQPLNLLLYFGLHHLQFVNAPPILGLFSEGTLLLYPQVILRFFQLVLQPGLRLLALRQLGFQLAAPLANLSRLLLGAFPTLGFLGERFRQPLDLLLYFRLRRPQFLYPCLKLGSFSEGALLLCPQLILRC